MANIHIIRITYTISDVQSNNKIFRQNSKHNIVENAENFGKKYK